MLCRAVTLSRGPELKVLCPDLLAIPQYQKFGVELVPMESNSITAGGEMSLVSVDCRAPCSYFGKLFSWRDFLNLIPAESTTLIVDWCWCSTENCWWFCHGHVWFLSDSLPVWVLAVWMDFSPCRSIHAHPWLWFSPPSPPVGWRSWFPPLRCFHPGTYPHRFLCSCQFFGICLHKHFNDFLSRELRQRFRV